MAGNQSIRVPTQQVDIDSTEWQRYFNTVKTTLSPSGSGTIYTTTDGGTTTTLVTFASLLLSGMVRNIAIGTTTTTTTNATNVYADTTLTASIAPSVNTSKILVLVFQCGCRKTTNDTGIQLRLVRGVTTLATFANGAGATGAADTNDIGTVATAYMDSPATTSNTTYKTQVASSGNSANAIVQANSESSAIVLVEVIV